MSEAALMSCAEASDLEATAEEEEELVSGSEDESGGQRHTGQSWQHCPSPRALVDGCL